MGVINLIKYSLHEFYHIDVQLFEEELSVCLSAFKHVQKDSRILNTETVTGSLLGRPLCGRKLSVCSVFSE